MISSRSIPFATTVQKGKKVISYWLFTPLVRWSKLEGKESPPAAMEAERVPQIEGIRLYKLLIRKATPIMTNMRVTART